MFQFALPRGERRFGKAFVFSFVKFQFALPRGERLDEVIVVQKSC